MKLIAYVLDGHSLNIRAAPPTREWMDSTDEKYAYRCLPLNIANCCGWEILCQEGFIVTWTGGKRLNDVIVQHDSQSVVQAGSHFGHGIVTFHISCLFRTEPSISLLATGPINQPKDGIAPLSGLIETDWAPYTFTMNWKFTRPGTVRFYKDEPFCHIIPMSCDSLESVEPSIRPIAEDPGLLDQFTKWADSRNKFNKGLVEQDEEFVKKKWQKLYYRGLDANACPIQGKHRTKLKLKEFTC